MELLKVKQLAMVGSGLFALSQILFLINNLVFRLPYIFQIVLQLLAVVGALLIFLFFYTVFEKDQKKNNQL